MIQSRGNVLPRSSSRSSSARARSSFAEGDEQLDVDGLAPIGQEVAHAHRVHELAHPHQRAIDLGVISGRVFDEREARQAKRLPPEDPGALGVICRERSFEPSSMRVDDPANSN